MKTVEASNNICQQEINYCRNTKVQELQRACCLVLARTDSSPGSTKSSDSPPVVATDEQCSFLWIAVHYDKGLFPSNIFLTHNKITHFSSDVVNTIYSFCKVHTLHHIGTKLPTEIPLPIASQPFG